MDQDTWLRRIQTFEDMHLRPALLQGVYGYGCERPSEIQRLAIVPCILGRDVLLQSRSGTGKTVAYIVSVLQRLDLNIKECQALIVVPTRERAYGIRSVVSQIGQFIDVTSMPCVGGVNIRNDILRLQAGVQIVVGTPGRLADFLQRLKPGFEKIKMLVFEEIDEILGRGFKEQVLIILKMLPTSVQIVVCAATAIPTRVQLIERWMKGPILIHWKSPDLSLEGIRQFYISVSNAGQKMDVLLELSASLGTKRMIVFCNEHDDARSLLEKMRQHGGVSAQVYEGSNNERDLIQMLISSELRIDNALRCLAPIRINYDLPVLNETYISRCGDSVDRRHFLQSVIITLVTDTDRERLKDIERFYQTSIVELPHDVSTLI